MKRKKSTEVFGNCNKKHESETLTHESPIEMIINLRIPHIGENIFSHFNTEELIQLLFVSETWRFLAENALLQRFRGQTFKASQKRKTEILKVILERAQIMKEDKRKSPKLNLDITLEDYELGLAIWCQA